MGSFEGHHSFRGMGDGGGGAASTAAYGSAAQMMSQPGQPTTSSTYHSHRRASTPELETQGSFTLGPNQPRRHSASHTAGPIRGSQFVDNNNNNNNNGASSMGGHHRSNSWAAPDSPKKGRRYSSGAGGGRQVGIVKAVVQHLRDSVFSMKALRNNRKEFALWTLLFVAIVVGYKLWSDGGFSAILTLSSTLQCFALALLNMKVFGQRSVGGVSRRSLWLITLSLCCRLSSTLFYNGYLPVDRSGDWVYQASDILTVALCLLLLVFGKIACNATVRQQQEKDNCGIVIPVVVSVVFATIVHPTLNQKFFADVSWTVALYIETFAMVPQLWLMANLGGEVEALTSHYVASMAASKVFAWLFWFFSFGELVPRTGGRNYAGWAVIFSYSVQALLFLDFFYYYIKSLRIGRSMIIDF